MSVHAITKPNGERYEVRWRTLAGAQRSQRFGDEAEAAGFDEALQARLALERAQQAWEEAPKPWRAHVQRRLAELT